MLISLGFFFFNTTKQYWNVTLPVETWKNTLPSKDLKKSERFLNTSLYLDPQQK